MTNPRVRSFGSRMMLSVTAAAVMCSIPAHALADAFEDAVPQRWPGNPLLTKGPAGSYDQVKIGPRAIMREGPADWKMWYEAVPSGNKSYTAYATSADGIAWTKYTGNPVMAPSAAWEGGANNAEGEVSPVSVLKEGGIYKLWYHGFSSNTRQIGYATSPDGIEWTKYPNNPILRPGPPGAWDQDTICEPNVIRVGAEYWMYYTHCAGAHGIGLATSSDGVTFTKYAGNPVLSAGTGWDREKVAWGYVYYDGSSFHMWYLGSAPSDPGNSLGYAWSADGKTFVKSTNNPLLVPTNPVVNSTDYAVNKGDARGLENRAVVVRRGSKWWIYYGGFAYCCPEDATLCLATAQVKTSGNRAPVVDAGANQVVLLGAVVSLDGTVMDDDVPVPLDMVSVSWKEVSGPGTATFAPSNAVDTTVTFDVAGTYVLELDADDTALKATSQVTITVEPPSTSPDAGPGTSGSVGSSTSGAQESSATSSAGSSGSSGSVGPAGNGGASTVGSASGTGGSDAGRPSASNGCSCGVPRTREPSGRAEILVLLLLAVRCRNRPRAARLSRPHPGAPGERHVQSTHRCSAQAPQVRTS